MFVGFSVGGIDWLRSDLEGTRGDAERDARINEIGFEEARLTHAMGGNMLRLFVTPSDVCAPLSAAPLRMCTLPEDYVAPWYMLPEQAKVEACDVVMAFLDSATRRLAEAPENGDALNLGHLDAYIAGVRRYGEAHRNGASPVRLLITLVVLPPRPILEAPGDGLLEYHRRAYRFADLWRLYLDLHGRVAGMLVRRYVSQPGQDGVVAAFEINNEPDYEWLPDELRIEKSAKPEVLAVRKYITELHNGQIPDSDDPTPPYEPSPWGAFRKQEGPWTRRRPSWIAKLRDEVGRRRGSNAAVLHFNWGPKFDWYVKCYADFAEHVSRALWTESRTAGSNLGVIAAGVTHNNVDYLMRMYRANPRCFDYCTGIALHPYHWPRHDIYDTEFWRTRTSTRWRRSTPRTFASEYFKYFDFFREVARLTRKRGKSSSGLAGKEIWLTEFGIPTKVLGEYNAFASAHVPFIRPRNWPADSIPFKSVPWEDLWDAFFNQVQPALLERYGVRALLFYTLRETAVPSFDKHDDDRSNFAVLRRNGLPRMESSTLDRFTAFMSSATAMQRTAADVSFRRLPPWARTKKFSTQLLRSAPWRAVTLPPEVENCISMLTVDEKQLLYWLGSEYFEGTGAIVDAGCFAGGSTVALASGLAITHGQPAEYEPAAHVIHSFDRFLCDSFMAANYFEPNKLTLEGDRFRHIFDANIRGLEPFINVHEGDITTFEWGADPIEVLFMDVAKTWEVNDHCVRHFFPRLIPGKSVLVQQDLFHNQEYWLAATQELLHDKFEYIGFAKWNSGVFRCIEPISVDDVPPRLRDLGLEELDRLVRRHIERYDDPYIVGILSCGLASLHLDFCDVDTARTIYDQVAQHYSQFQWVAQALQELSGALASRGAKVGSV